MYSNITVGFSPALYRRPYATTIREYNNLIKCRKEVFKKNLNASKPSEHPPSGEKMSEGLGGNINGCRGKPLHGIKRVPQCNHIGSTDSIISGRSPPLDCTLVNLHAGTPKPQSFLSIWEFRTTVVVIWSYMVLEKLNKLY